MFKNDIDFFWYLILAEYTTKKKKNKQNDG